jgi:hypothetical protein
MNDIDNDINICQSCGMPLSVNEDFGTEIDGSLNSEYCKFCYQDGKFTDEGITLEEKIEKNAEIATTLMGIPKDEALQIAKDTIPTLKRWL